MDSRGMVYSAHDDLTIYGALIHLTVLIPDITLYLGICGLTAKILDGFFYHLPDVRFGVHLSHPHFTFIFVYTV
jgi:hypothetical protein